MIIDKLFTTTDSLFNGFDIKQFRNILDSFLFSELFYIWRQCVPTVDGLSMGGPVSPVAANIF